MSGPKIIIPAAGIAFSMARNIQHQLFGPRLGDAFTAELNQRDDFQLIGSYQRLSGEPVNLYERLH